MAKSKVFSVRLHPSDEREARVISILDDLISKGFSMREIFTDAILRAEGYTPEMFRDTDERITRTYLETLLSEFGQDLLSQIENGTISAKAQTDKRPSPFGDDEDEDAMRNIAQGFMNRRSRNK